MEIETKTDPVTDEKLSTLLMNNDNNNGINYIIIFFQYKIT